MKVVAVTGAEILSLMLGTHGLLREDTRTLIP